MFQAPSTINKISTLADSTIRIVVDCQELPPEQMAEIFRLKGKLGFFLFKENEIQIEDVPEEEAEFEDQKSLSQRLRNALYVFWKKRNEEGKVNQDFEEFRKKWYERKIKQIIDNIDI